MLATALTGRSVFAQAVTPPTAVDSVMLERANAFAARIRTLLESQNVDSLARMTAALRASAPGGAPALIRFLGAAQIVSSGGGDVVGAMSGLSVTVVSPGLWILTGVDDSTVSAEAKGRRVWTAFVNMREQVPALLYLHVSPARL